MVRGAECHSRWLAACSLRCVPETPEPYIWPPPRSTAKHLKVLQLDKSTRAMEMPQVLLDRSTTPTSPIPHRPLSTFFPWAPSCSQTSCSIAPKWLPGSSHLHLLFRARHSRPTRVIRLSQRSEPPGLGPSGLLASQYEESTGSYTWACSLAVTIY